MATIDIECSKGTYVRSLANDLGEYLGCGAHLKNLIRTRNGDFTIENAVSITELERAFRESTWQQLLYPIDYPLRDIPSITVDGARENDIRNGKRITVENAEKKAKYCRAYAEDGRFLAILRQTSEKGVWQPKKVLA